MAENMEEQEINQNPQQQQQQSFSSLLRTSEIDEQKKNMGMSLYNCIFNSLMAWNLFFKILSWYKSSSSSSHSGWPALYTSVLPGVVFGLLSMAATASVALPAMVVTWMTIIVLLTFFEKPKRALVVGGRKITGEITGLVLKILLKEGNVVAAICAVLGYFALVRRNSE